MQTVILLAGYGSRLNRADLPHKSLLAFDGQTLLSRHLACLEELRVEKAILVLGHNKNLMKEYIRKLGLQMDVEFVDNDLYATTGNTLSLVIGLRRSRGDVLIMDGDVLYPASVLRDYVTHSPLSSFAVIPADIDDVECSKVLLRSDGSIESFVTKRALTAEERARFGFAGEAIGFIKLSSGDAKNFVDLYDRKSAAYEPTLWEIPFTDFASNVQLFSSAVPGDCCFEIDTQEDYETALDCFKKNPEKY